ncbi:MAG: FMN-binding negative transcriptional regulator [Planctomycetaceae bacterium]|nr:FMN-binding negative transcriptional regulator [Planctomycetaceae bacterium]
MSRRAMYVPASFAVDDPDRLFAFLHKYPFATLVTAAGDELFASHLPLLVDRDGGEHGTLRGHVARANPHWQAFDGQARALVIFHGPHAYVSPQWYVKRPAVPTWNYAAVHVYGVPRVIAEPERVSQLLVDLNQRFDHGPGDTLSDELRQSLEAAIVGFELTIDRWEGKFKLGQNRGVADRAGTVEHLSRSARAEDQLLAKFMREQGVLED